GIVNQIMTDVSSSVKIKAAAAVNVNVTTTNIRQPHISLITSGYCEVGKSFGKDSYFSLKHTIKIYYEIHGNGPNKLLFIMGMLRFVACILWQELKFLKTIFKLL